MRCSIPQTPVLILVLLVSQVVNPVTAAIETWSPIGPQGGNILALAVAPGDPRRLYVGTPAGVFHSHDGGLTWNAMGGIELGFLALAVDPNNPEAVLASAADGRLSSPVLWRTADAGRTWSESAGGDAAGVASAILALQFHPSDPEVVYALAQREGVLRSRDQGRTWTLLPGPAGPFKQLVIDPDFGERLYLISENGRLDCSDDGGRAWSTCMEGLRRGQGVVSLVFDASHPRTLFLLADRLYHSHDGRRWEPLPHRLPPGNFEALTTHPQDQATLYLATREGLFVSRERGPWKLISRGQLPYGRVRTLLVHPHPERLLATTESGVWSSLDGALWDSANAGLFASTWSGLAAVGSAAGTEIFAWRGHRLARSSDRSGPWTVLGLEALPGINTLTVDATDPDRLWAGSRGLYTSSDGGFSWVLAETPFNYRGVSQVVIAPSDAATMYVGLVGESPLIYRSIDRGVSWQPAGSGLLGQRIAALVVHPRDPALVYAGTYSETYSETASEASGPGLYQSRDGGSTWTRLDLPLNGSSGIYCLAIDPQRPATVYAGTVAGWLLKSQDSGRSWTPHLVDRSLFPVVALAVDPARPQVLYASTFSGLSRSTDGGLTWTPAEQGLSLPRVTALALDPAAPSKVYASVPERGIFEAIFPQEDAAYFAEGRFQVQASWTDFMGQSGRARPLPLTSSAAAFWFFQPSNPELVVKLLDGRKINGGYWWFHGGLTNFAFAITLTDLATGRQQTFNNPPGQFTSHGEIDVLRNPKPTTTFPSSQAPQVLSPGPVPADLTCATNAERLCLGQRFRVNVEWRNAHGRLQAGQARGLSESSGYFWFAQPENVELLVKMLDGQAFNGKFWLFSGALTNLEYTLTVTDTVTGETQRYRNPAGSFTSFGDIQAF